MHSGRKKYTPQGFETNQTKPSDNKKQMAMKGNGGVANHLSRARGSISFDTQFTT